MTTAQIAINPIEFETADHFKRLGITYWLKLIREGVPREEAHRIALAIAKFDMFDRAPSEKQKALIAEFSASICRAQLWRGHLLL